MRFANRSDAGRVLAKRLRHLAGRDVVVVGLPRGGVPVAYEVATALKAPLDVLVVRKLGVPDHPELAMGAIGEGNALVLNESLVGSLRISSAQLHAVEADERFQLERSVQRFRPGRHRVPLRHRTVVVVDDGIATGATARVACQMVRAQAASYVVVATPVASADAVRSLREFADEVIALNTPEHFAAVGQWYWDFDQTSDAEVIDLLEHAAARSPESSAPPPRRLVTAGGWRGDVDIPVGRVTLEGELVVPDHPIGVVVFAHGSGSSRHSRRNRYVAEVLNKAGLATLLFDLLTESEEIDRENVFDIRMLAGRLRAATAWLRQHTDVGAMPIGYFGASTGGGAALWAAADDGGIAAVVSRGGRPDLARPRLANVRAPTLLIVGSRDRPVIHLNTLAASQLRCEHRMELVDGATHVFQEPGTLERVADLARDWFVSHTHVGTGDRAQSAERHRAASIG